MEKKEKKKKVLTAKDLIANLKRDHKWKGNILQLLAEQVFQYALPPEEILKNNLTETFLKELEREIKNGEIIKGQTNAKPRLGKSTLDILLGKFIFGLLIKYGHRKEEEEFTMDNIARDQGEKAKKLREPERMYDIIITDESNALEDTGENSTVEKAQRDTYTDVQAGRYIHTWDTCPEGTMDKNTDIKLEIRNKDEGYIHTRVFYKMNSSMYYGWILIGYADFDVRELIKRWKDVEPRFMRLLKEKREDDRKYVEYWSKRDMYVLYMIKKYEKMEILNREGIPHARDLDYAEIRKVTTESIRPLAELPFIGINNLRNNTKTRVEIEFKKRNLPLSIIGKNEETDRIMGILTMYRNRVDLKKQIDNTKQRYLKGKMTQEEYDQTMTILVNARDEIEKEIHVNEENMKRMDMLRKKYNEYSKEKR